MRLSSPDFYELIVTPTTQSMRIDNFIHAQLPHLSRTYVQKLIADKKITINNQSVKRSAMVKPDDIISIYIPPIPPLLKNFTSEETNLLQQMSIEIIFNHPDFLIINKGTGIITHKPSAHSTQLTLVDWLLFYFKDLIQVGNPERPGIVHRLDKDTSGLIIIARNNKAHAQLSSMFKDRLIKKKYLAIVEDHPHAQGLIDLSVGRDRITRNKMSIHGIAARKAITEYKVLEYFDKYAFIELQPITGRTHQLRIHCAAIGHPIIGDTLYSKKSMLIKRQALHAYYLNFNYKNENFTFEISLPKDIEHVLEHLKKSAK